VHGDIGHLQFIDPCLQIQRQFLANDSKILVVDGERRLHNFVGGQTYDA
jgi:hypothetical protein